MTFRRTVLGLTFLATGIALLELGIPALQDGRIPASSKWMLVFILGGLFFSGTGVLWGLSLTPRWQTFEAFFQRGLLALRRIRWVGIPILGLVGIGWLELIYLPYPALFERNDLFLSPALRLSLLWVLGVLTVPFWLALFPRLRGVEALAGALLFLGLLHRGGEYFFAVRDYPFSLGWSEASRFYYGSLFHSQAIYGESTPLPFLHPSRYLLLSIPHLIGNLPLWAHRLWQALLWFGMPLLNAFLLARRLSLASRSIRWLFIGWSALFLMQGPVYYHLLVASGIVLAGFDSRRFWRSFFVIVLASLWAGISRVNWFPVPAMLAIMLYLLEQPYPGNFWRWVKNPVIWGISGVVSAFLAQAMYIALSRQPDISSFGSSFFSSLLWYRLLPSPTYPPGILPLTVILSLPILFLIALNGKRQILHPLRLLGLSGMVFILFAGGLVVSTKIGGGANLHNLDAYWMTLWIWGSALFSGQVTGEQHPGVPFRKPAILIALAFILPFYPAVMEGRPIPVLDKARAEFELSLLKSYLKPAVENQQPVLFIWQRQLLTFHQIEGLRLIFPYETIDLMEYAMSDNRAYLQQFYDDLCHQRFAVIVSAQQNIVFKSPQDTFPEENNVWVTRVTIPILSYYKPLDTLDQSGTQILIPKENPPTCLRIAVP
ncbi:hypothetical protein [Anaerolinea thermophila]|uniref:Hypothetical membrane protein n=1 Tax=Anaerolinea thermophila (strain DSM 14523 / JCM 11388 / NBRC 100420 / UNI-1) TaxID=926569 RepID=E8N1P4_ANATU|nr:hypothetical protein [Anaerolinea thermophila]BAJ62649.1 hypothetical membrane protein [Anaerolinea thermophila UNI-1]